jgi:DNA-binding MltR family transcriptional regulator
VNLVLIGGEGDNLSSLMRQLSQDSDRAAGIVGAALVENRLERALRGHLLDVPEVQQRLFRTSGPLSALAVKIDLALLNGLISHAAHADLRIVKAVRNDFAHHLTWNSFEEPSIRDRCTKLRLVDTLVADTSTNPHLTGGAISGFDGAAEELKKPRQRYIQTVTTFAVKLLHRRDVSSPFI